MKNKSSSIEKKSHGLKALVFYGIVVLGIVFVALLIRSIYVIEESKFDTDHQFTLSIGRESQVLALITFEPIVHRLSMLTFSKDQHISFSSLNRDMGIIPDGYIKIRGDLAISGTVSSILQSLIFHWNTVYTNITLYDLFRLWFFSYKIPFGAVYNQKISDLSDTRSIDKVLVLRLADNELAGENLSIQIINASGESGLGLRLARVISNLGGNVVSVRTASAIVSISKIQYNGRQTYTLRKIESLLPYRSEKLRDKTIAEIVIIIGKDNANTKSF